MTPGQTSPGSFLWTEGRHRLDYRIRQSLRWSPKAHERPEPKEGLFEHLGPRDQKRALQREAGWLQTLGLAPTRERMSRARWLRTLEFLGLLESAATLRTFSEGLARREELHVLDIGSKNFDYVDALAAFFSHHRGRRTVHLTGLEIDAFRRTTDFRTRQAWARCFCAGVPGANYLAQDLLEHRGRYDVVTWFFPFLTEFPLVRWGLPRSFLRPQELLDHALGLLKPGGWLIIVNLNADEAVIQKELLQNSGREWFDLGRHPVPFRHPPGDQRIFLVLGA